MHQQANPWHYVVYQRVAVSIKMKDYQTHYVYLNEI